MVNHLVIRASSCKHTLVYHPSAMCIPYINIECFHSYSSRSFENYSAHIKQYLVSSWQQMHSSHMSALACMTNFTTLLPNKRLDIFALSLLAFTTTYSSVLTMLEQNTGCAFLVPLARGIYACALLKALKFMVAFTNAHLVGAIAVNYAFCYDRKIPNYLGNSSFYSKHALCQRYSQRCRN